MFIANNKFKALLKEACKNGRLRIGLDENNMYYIDGVIWHMEVPKEYLSNAIKAQIVELTGELPQAGEAYTCSQTDKQELPLEALKEGTWEVYEDAKTGYVEETRVSVRTDGGVKKIFQGVGGDGAYMVPEEFTQCISTSSMDDGETMKSPKIISSRVYFAGNQMAIWHMIHLPKFAGEDIFLNTISNCDLDWIQADEERI